MLVGTWADAEWAIRFTSAAVVLVHRPLNEGETTR
jgi:hypothetical protein